MHLLSLANSEKKQNFHPSTINSALDWLKDPKNQALPLGKYDIGNGCFAIVQEYEPKPFLESEFENHHQKIDIQFLVNGNEFLYWTSLREAKGYKAYSNQDDIEFFTPALNEAFYTRIALGGDRAVILWPGDWHMPCIKNQLAASTESKVKKIVIKIPVQ
jgi:YhcH/YjgK/YiaL family protein